VASGGFEPKAGVILLLPLHLRTVKDYCTLQEIAILCFYQVSFVRLTVSYFYSYWQISCSVLRFETHQSLFHHRIPNIPIHASMHYIPHTNKMNALFHHQRY
jgi:hypothetical protein